MDDLTPIDPNQLNSLVPSSQGSTTIALSVNAPEPLWWDKLEMMAIDKRQDWAPGILSYWTEKLQSYRDHEICEALHLYTGQFFPSVDEIIRHMDRARERRYEEKAAQPPKVEPGQVLASQADYDELKRKAREIFAKANKSNDLQFLEKNKKVQQQSRVLGCESESR